jgi:hypothetical protein
MHKIPVIFFLLISLGHVYSQELPEAYRAYQQQYPEGPALNHWDSLYLMNIPEKVFPAALRSNPLPPLVDNSVLPYLRPVFNQEGASCGQAAMVGYNFTYEMAYLRNQSANSPQTQYPSHFTWNFQNGGNGWYGVSYFHSIEILRCCGNMNVWDYGDYYDDGKRWINGYDLYYNGMYNRAKGVFSIHTGTEEGLLALKHWLLDHMGEGIHGGVASYYACSPWNVQLLNDTTPEGGKHVMTAYYPMATHAMTIIGYNDSIRWDYNGDGTYTNHIDLNSDGIIDPRDWEIGAVKFVNSHGAGSLDSGFCYMMYKCLAETFENGGVWNQAVHILEIDQDYQPLITFKVKLKHDYRQKVKILAGVSQDTVAAAPGHLMEFPIIDYQGANHFMQGQDTAEYLKYLEFGLDVTPLLSYLQPGETAKFFFIVDENDPLHEGEGEITFFSLMDYTSGQQEVISAETPITLWNNSRTMVSVIHSPEFDRVEISTDSLPPFALNQPYNYQLQAEGGLPPYSWEPQFSYRMEQSSESFPYIDDIKILFNADTDTIMPVPLGFSFPYFGGLYDTVWMHINGHLQFDNAQLPWPYLEEPVLHFRSNRLIAPMTHIAFTIAPVDGDGGWVAFDDSSATFRWKLSRVPNTGTTDLNFAARISQNGTIEFIYGPSTLKDIPWLGGLSAGNNEDWLDSPYSGAASIPGGSKVSYFYGRLPQPLDFSPDGLLTGLVDTDDFIYDLSFRVTDRSGITDCKTLQFTSGPYLYFTVNASGDDQLDFGDTVTLDLEIRNGGGEAMTNALLELLTDDPYIEMLDPVCQPGTLLPGQAVVIPGAFQFVVSTEVPDQRDLFLDAVLTSSENVWHKDLILRANAPDLQLTHIVVDDENGRLDPGETAPLLITYRNAGHAAIDGISAGLSALEQEVQVLGTPVQDFGLIGIGASVTRSFTLQAQETTPDGFKAHLVLSAQSQQELQRIDTFELRVGLIPVLIIDLDPNNHSGPGILAQLEELNVSTDYEYGIFSKISSYKSLFVCLGYHNSNHVLTQWEGQQLAGYLDQGGRIYMEGRKIWKDDPWTPVLPKFNLTWAGTATVFDTLTGLIGTFTQGITLRNAATTPFSFYHIEPIEPAFTILQDNDNLKPCAIAYDAGSYKTIGTLFEFGTLEDISPGASRELMLKYLDFFDIYVEPVGVEEWHTDKLQIKLYPNPAGDQLTVDSWHTSSITISDLFGRQLKAMENISSFPFLIDISDLGAGLYILQMINQKGESASVKFMKVSR